MGWFSVVSRKMIPHFDCHGIWRPHIIFTCSQNHSIFQTLYTITVSINKLSQAKLISIAVLSMSRKCPVEPTDSYARSNQANGKFVWLINVCYQDWLGVVMKKNKARQMACIVRRHGSGNDRALISFSKFEVNSFAFTQHLLPHHVLWCAMQLKQ